MAAVSETTVRIHDREGVVRGFIRVSLLPNSRASTVAPLLDLTGERERDPVLESIQLLEDWEYLYEIQTEPHNRQFDVDRADLFSPDVSNGIRGRLRTQSYVGLLPITITADGLELGSASFEVRSRKLDYMTHYRWMLRDLAQTASAILLERFAPTQLRFVPHELLNGATAYERFSLLQGLIRGSLLTSALHQIMSDADNDWKREPTFRAPAQGLAGNSAAFRALVTPGPRIPWPDSELPGLRTLPRRIELTQLEETIDTPPNRFVKFALGRWLSLLTALRRSMERMPDSPVRRRGLREIQEVLDYVDGTLSEPFFRNVGTLTYFPANNQVLLKREGYRDILAAHAIVEGAVQVAWSGGQDVFGAGQKDVASLYEFWTFLEVIKAMKQLCTTFEESQLIQITEEGANLTLKRGREACLTGLATRLDRQIHVSVSFNRTFSASSNEAGSWTRAMRPDCSIHLHTGDPQSGHFEDLWLHFDAKYRIDHLIEVLGAEGVDSTRTGASDNESETTAAKRDDLLKMHAYRDAIRRSAGSYVLYPGIPSDQEDGEFRRYHEILPGLGAFALRPSETDDAEGSVALKGFLDDILIHFASVISQERRGRYWEATSFDTPTRVDRRFGWEPSLARPPADTAVLLGYVRNVKHLEWIRRNYRYNLRAGPRRGSVGLTSRELAADVVALYGPPLPAPEFWLVQGEPEIWQRERLIAAGYPEPGGDLYFCLPLQNKLEFPNQLISNKRLLAIRTTLAPTAVTGEPVVTTWLELVR